MKGDGIPLTPACGPLSLRKGFLDELLAAPFGLVHRPLDRPFRRGFSPPGGVPPRRALAGARTSTSRLRGLRRRLVRRFVGRLVLGRRVLGPGPLRTLGLLAVGFLALGFLALAVRACAGRILPAVFRGLLAPILGRVQLWPVGQVALVVLIALEIGLIPAAALEPKHRRRHQPLQLRLAAMGTLFQRRIADFLHGLQIVAAALALILVKRHVFPMLSLSLPRRLSITK